MHRIQQLVARLRMNHRLEDAAWLLRTSTHAVALTGAGISTPSGIPDFRSPVSGLWQQVDPMEVASLSAFQRRPEAFYEWVRPLAHRIHLAHPNPAHLALADLETRGLIKAIITQNIDNLHQKAGSRTVYEIHGTLREATCLRCFAQTPLSSYLDAYLRNGDIPHCPSCGGILKPNVVLFGEMLPPHTFWQAQESIRSCDVLLVVGSSLEVAPASDLPKLALRHGAHLIIVNRGTTAFDHAADVLIHEDAALILPRLAELISLTA